MGSTDQDEATSSFSLRIACRTFYIDDLSYTEYSGKADQSGLDMGDWIVGGKRMLRRKFAAICVTFILFFSLGTSTVLARSLNSKYQESISNWVEKQWAGHKIQDVRIDSIQTKGDIQFVVVSYVKDGKFVFSMEIGLKQKGVFEAVYGATSLPHVQGQKLSPIDQMAVGGTMGASHTHYFMQGGYVNDRNITVVRIKFNDGTVKQLRVPSNHLFAYGTLTATGVRQLTGFDRHGHLVWTMN